jgi:Ser/Thr protein kinase RdoA (MazF antagonist)
VQDLWLLFPGRDEHSKKQLQSLIDAYRQMKDFDQRSLVLVEPLRSLRMIHFNAWIAKRWEDPAFPRTFVEFGTNKYWREQIAQLEEQLALINSL